LIDEIPILACAARFAVGTSRFRGLGELRVKESDRLAMTIALIEASGGKAWAEGDDLLVEGSSAPVPAFRFDPDADHRLAMAAAVLAKVASGPCVIQDPGCVAVSFPGFFSLLRGLVPL
jgi:3-phosphoshikimate 1-carboxyvinyltransferase